MAKTILVVDDTASLRRMVASYLTQEGFRVLTAADGQEALMLARQEQPDLILLDLMMPNMGGYEFIRAYGSNGAPIIILTAKLEENDKVLGLELGADDYVTKPISLRELTARVRAVLRRTDATTPGGPSSDGALLEVGDVSMDLAKHAVSRGGEPVELTVKEYDLLRMLLENAGRVVNREHLIREVWETTWLGSTKTLDVHVSALRRKLGDDPAAPRYIHTVRGVGFRFASGAELEA